jgi:hypothetical protein
MLISISLLISSANLATRELDEPPKTISSTYTCTIRISLPCLEGPIRRPKRGGSEWEPIKNLLEGD